MKLFLRAAILLLLCNVLVISAIASGADSTAMAAPPKKNSNIVAGDKQFAKLNFSKAIGHYSKALQQGSDSLYAMQKIAECYRITGDYGNAETWYAKLADNEQAQAINKLYYAQLLSRDKNYEAAKKYYSEYAKAASAPKNMSAELNEMEKLSILNQGSEAYSLSLLPVNSPQSDFAPVYYVNGKLIFTSNRGKANAMYDKWSLDKHMHVYIASLDSTNSVKEVKLRAGQFATTAAFNQVKGELIFSSGSFCKKGLTNQSGKRAPQLKLYSAVFNDGKAKDIVPLAVSNTQFSDAHPTISKDGNVMYFTSDRLGGFGGTDLYACVRTASGNWSEPQNLGAGVNSAFNEKFPFIADDGTLYFASDRPSGLGGLDIYKTANDVSGWQKPENLGAPVNSSSDDFSFIIDDKNQSGYLASDRKGGPGKEDIYHFIYDATKLDYKVILKVIDEATLRPLSAVTLALDCNTPNAENSLTDAKGEKEFSIKGGKNCVVEAIRPGYKPAETQITSANNGGTIIIPLKADFSIVSLEVRNPETGKRIRNITLTLTGGPDNTTTNYTTGDSGVVEARLAPGIYKISSPDYPSLSGVLSTSNVDPNTGILRESLAVPNEKINITVPLTANCFTSTVGVTDLKTGLRYELKPDGNGELRINLKVDSRYLIDHNGMADTINTYGAEPGSTLTSGQCRFFVGQAWLVPNIYYDLNKWFIRKDAGGELDKLADIMKENPTLEVELTSFTDCRSSARYNAVLSARRAKSAVDYLGKKGIKKRRIVAAGYGESRLTNNCYCEPGDVSYCSPQQHQDNRRTEVRVLRY